MFKEIHVHSPVINLHVFYVEFVSINEKKPELPVDHNGPDNSCQQDLVFFDGEDASM